MGEIAALVFDIDDTLVTRAGHCHPRTLAAVRACRERGVPMFIATARRYASARRHLGPLAELLDDGVYNAGASLHLDGALAHAWEIDGPTVAEASDLLLRHPAIHAVSLARADGAIAFSRELSEAELGEWGVLAEDLHPFAEARCQACTRLAAWSRGEQVALLAGTLDASFPDRFATNLVDGDTCLFATRREATKGTALQRLLALRGIDPADCVAFGDDISDLTTFAVCGRSFAMADAKPEVHARATDRTGLSGEGGIADALEALGLVGDTARPIRL